MSFVTVLSGVRQAAADVFLPSDIDGLSLWLDASQGVSTSGARQFTASDKAYLTIADNTSLSTGDIDFTIAGWVYADTFPSSSVLASKLNSSGAGEWNLTYETASNRFKFKIWNASSIVGTATSDNAGNGSTGKWYFVVAWHDSVANTVNIQVNNGTADSSSTTGAPVDTTTAFSIGSHGNGVNFWDGKSSKFGFWKRTLTAAERTFLYNAGNGQGYGDIGVASTDGSALKTSLEAYWNLNESDGTGDAIDAHGSNDLTPTFTELLSNTGFETRSGLTWRNFVGSDNAALTVASAAAHNLGTGDAVITATFKRSSIGTVQYICGKYQNNSNYWALNFNSSNKLSFIALSSSSTIVQLVTTNSFASTSTVYSVSVVLDRSNVSNSKIIVNGTDEALTTATDTGADIDNTGKFGVGNMGDFYQQFVDAQVAQVGIGKVADASDLSVVTAATALYNSGLGKYYSEISSGDRTTLGITAFYDCTDISGTQEDDRVSSNDLTLDATEMLSNTGFESGGAGDPDFFANWIEATTGTGAIADEIVIFDTGTHSAKLTSGTPAGSNRANVYQSILTNGNSYSYSVRARGGSGTPTLRVFLGVSSYVHVLTTSFATYTGTQTADDVYAQFFNNTTDSSDIYIDTTSVKAASIPLVSDADIFGSWTELAGTTNLFVNTSDVDAGNISARALHNGTTWRLQQTSITTAGNSYTSSLRLKGTDASSTIRFPENLPAFNKSTTTSYATVTNTNATAASTTAQIIYSAGTTGAAVYVNLDTVSLKAAAIAPAQGPTTQTAIDSSSSDNDGTLVNMDAADWSTDTPDGSPRANESRQFTHANSERFASSDTDMDITDTSSESFTIETMFYADSLPSGGDGYAGAGGASVHRTDAIGDFMCGVTSDGRVGFAVWENSGADADGVSKTAAGVIVTGRWYHIMWVWTAGSGKTLFVNGEEVSFSFTATTASSWGTNRSVGATYSVTSTYHQNGRLSRFRFWNEAKDATYALSAYNGGEGLKHSELSSTTNLATSLDLDERTGNATDQTGNMTWVDTNTVTAAFGPKLNNLPVLGAGYSLDFDGTDDYVDIPTKIISSGSYSQSFWVKFSGLDSSAERMLCQGTSGGGAFIHFDKVGTTHIIRHSMDASTFVVADSAVSQDVWYHVVATHDSTGPLTKLYINGVQQTDTNATAANYTGDQVEIGRSPSGSGPVAGNIDDVRIYNDVLTAAEVLSLYTEGAEGTDPTSTNLVGHWKFDDGPQSLGITDGDPIVLWQSIDSGRRQFVQLTRSKQPIYIESSINGLPAARFEGTDDFLRYDGPLFSSDTSGTIFLILKVNDAATGGQYAFSSSDEGGNANYMAVRMIETSTTPDDLMSVVHVNSGGTDSVHGSTDAATGNFLITATSTGTAYALRVNGADETETASAGTNLGDWFGDLGGVDNVVLGALKRAAGESQFFNGDIAYGLVYSGDLTAGEITQVENFLNSRFSIY